MQENIAILLGRYTRLMKRFHMSETDTNHKYIMDAIDKINLVSNQVKNNNNNKNKDNTTITGIIPYNNDRFVGYVYICVLAIIFLVIVFGNY